ncbi:spindle assembly abnormal protein 6 homolog isoform X1 [Rhopalosiphum maidis]|uniref:spindle assembly abnormal protein 6 homolog isoform X1 n=2 Tax=Rhopalosiphum maidis TaxID=43146 RepID=UPI000EFDDCF1|nr:spindle assembly abnormal protein 6 homolog isoform X1 [Rhopalosiphum maidis]XP_026809257.1 spindle assembly abnormal protein 6 homolog isoform X1 [Rhopalosiphum maidis]
MKGQMYSKLKNVYIKDTWHNEKVPLDIVITVEQTFRDNEKTIFISASDENDPLFYITANVTEESFRTIKESQDLVVCFDGFPNQIIQLLNNSDATGDDGPKFKLLIQDECMGNKIYKGPKYVLKIIELNEFKNLCHLAIEMSKASDSDVAKNICKKMTSIKNIIELKDKETDNLKRELLKLHNELANKNIELEKCQSSMNHEKINLTTKQEQIIDQWKEKYEKLDAERMKQLREMHEEMIAQQERLSTSLQATIKSQNKEIQSLLTQSENRSEQISEMSIRIKTLESKNKTLIEETTSLINTNENLISDRDIKKKIIERMQNHILSLENEIKQNTKLLQKQNNYYDISNKLQEQLSIVVKENEELKKHNEDNLKSMCDELKQANKIIKKLHDSNQEQTQKLMLSKDIALKQKEDILRYQSENTKLSKSLEEKTSSIENLNIQLLETKNRLTVVEQNLKEKEERLASNDKVIHWLNSKLNNCEIVAKSSSNCGVLSETTNVTKNANVKSMEKFSTSTPATTETDNINLKSSNGRKLNSKTLSSNISETLTNNTKRSAPIRRVMYGPLSSAPYFAA